MNYSGLIYRAVHYGLRVIASMSGAPQLVVMLLYGAGLRLSEAMHLRVKDVDLSRHAVVIRAGKGNKDRRSMLPAQVIPMLAEHLERERRRHALRVKAGGGHHPLPGALARKFPGAPRDWRWPPLERDQVVGEPIQSGRAAACSGRTAIVIESLCTSIPM